MAQKPEDKLLNTIQDQPNDLSLTGQPVLVQNNLGIFYGFLEKSDTRSGTALLRDGFILSPDRHITFSQYLDFLSGEMNQRLTVTASRAYLAGEEMDEEDLIDADNAMPNEILISESVFNEHKRSLSITDYASEGVFLVQHRTSTHENSKHLQTSAPLVSLTDVIAIVAISKKNTLYPSMLDIKELVENMNPNINMLHGDISPMFSFFLIDGAINYLRLHKEWMIRELNVTNEEALPYNLDYYLNSSIFKYATDTMFSSGKYYSEVKKLHASKNYADDRIYALEFFEEILEQMPTLIVNSNQRADLYNKKAQVNEQDT